MVASRAASSRSCARRSRPPRRSARTQRDLYLRAAAELENVRKRAQRDIENAHRYAIEGLAAELLPVRDGLELGVRNGATADARTLLAGQEATLKLLDRSFEKFSIKQLDPAGAAFRPESARGGADAGVGCSGAEHGAAGSAAGLRAQGRLLRPARVVVAKAAKGS